MFFWKANFSFELVTNLKSNKISFQVTLDCNCEHQSLGFILVRSICFRYQDLLINYMRNIYIIWIILYSTHYENSRALNLKHRKLMYGYFISIQQISNKKRSLSLRKKIYDSHDRNSNISLFYYQRYIKHNIMVGM